MVAPRERWRCPRNWIAGDDRVQSCRRDRFRLLCALTDMRARKREVTADRVIAIATGGAGLMSRPGHPTVYAGSHG